MITATKYSQRDEEQYILSACGDVAGRFLDVGSWHAKDMSNTRALRERGWSGVMIEPSPEPFLGLLREYGKDDDMVLIPAAVGLSHGIERFHISADALSTNQPANYEKWKSVGGFYGCAYVPVVTLSDILGQFGAFDMVSIDTEGSSLELFAELLRFAMRPRCIVVEHDEKKTEADQIAARAGYRLLYRSAENCVYSL